MIRESYILLLIVYHGGILSIQRRSMVQCFREKINPRHLHTILDLEEQMQKMEQMLLDFRQNCAGTRIDLSYDKNR